MISRSSEAKRPRAPYRRRVLAPLLLGMALLIASSGGVSAGRAQSVDPGFMTPALNPAVDWECWRAASQIICEGTATGSWSAVEIAPCSDGGVIYSSGFDSRRIRRVSDSDGRALTSLLFVQTQERFSRSPDMGGVRARGIGQFSVSFDWVVPGDLSSRTSILRGVDLSVTVAGHGMLLHDVGVKSYDFDDNLLFARGVHPIADDADAAFERLFMQLCDALAGD